MELQSFEDSYNLCAKQPDKYLGEYFKRFIDELLPQGFSKNPLRTAMITGYFLRCAESFYRTTPLKESDLIVEEILNSDKDKDEKIKAIAEYLDNHDRIGLPNKITNYTSISFQDAQRFFEYYAENFIKHTLSQNRLSKNETETLYELSYRNMAFGYLYKLAEEFVEG
jgi:hypothetical protein